MSDAYIVATEPTPVNVVVEQSVAVAVVGHEGLYSHTAIDAHIADATIHFIQSNITATGTVTVGTWSSDIVTQALDTVTIDTGTVTNLTSTTATLTTASGTWAGTVDTALPITTTNNMTVTGAAGTESTTVHFGPALFGGAQSVASAALSIYHKFQPSADSHIFGIRGYCWPYGAEFDGRIAAALDFGVYVQFQTSGSAGMDAYGVKIVGSSGYGATLSAKNIYGGHFTPMNNVATFTCNVAENVYGLYVKDASRVGGTGPTNHYGIYVEKPTLGTPFQLFLDGTGAGSGVYFDGASPRVWSSAANTLDLTCTTLNINGTPGATGSGTNVTVVDGIVTAVS